MSRQKRKDKEARIHQIGFVIFTVFLFLLHRQWDLNTNDDLWYQTQLTQQTLGTYLNWRYHNWTSRILIEAVLVTIVQKNVWLWRCIDIIAMLIITEGISFLALDQNQHTQRISSYLFFCIIPFQIYAESGYGATTINYIWPAACCTAAFCLIKQTMNNNRVPFVAYPAVGAAVIFAVNQEQMAAVMFGITIVLLVYELWIRKRMIRQVSFLLYVVLVSLLSVFHFLFCPGNAARMITEMEINPQYMEYGFFDRLRIGVVSEGLYFFCGFGKNLILFTLIGALIYRGLKSGKRSLVVLQFPCIFALCGSIFAKISARSIGNKEMMYMENITANKGIIGTVLFLFILILWIILFISIALLDISLEKKLLLQLILLAGIMARLVIGFSPSVFNSGFRTTLYSSFCFMLTAIIVFFDQTAAVRLAE